MQFQQELTSLIDACRSLGMVQLHYTQGHASTTEVDEAEDQVKKSQANLMLALSKDVGHAAAKHVHDSECGHQDDQAFVDEGYDCDHTHAVRIGFIQIEAFMETEGMVMHLTTHDGSNLPIELNMALNLMAEAATQMFLEVHGNDL